MMTGELPYIRNGMTLYGQTGLMRGMKCIAWRKNRTGSLKRKRLSADTGIHPTPIQNIITWAWNSRLRTLILTTAILSRLWMTVSSEWTHVLLSQVLSTWLSSMMNHLFNNQKKIETAP